MTLAELKAWRPTVADHATIQRLVDLIAEAVQPERIVLFGSYARGEASPDSDVDLLVIAPSDEPPPHRSMPLYRLLRYFRIPLDILVRTPTEVQESAALPYSFIQTALREGETLYARTP